MPLERRHSLAKLYSSPPALQVYTGVFLEVPFISDEGVWLEPQDYVGGPNQLAFPSVMINPGQVYRHSSML